MALNILKNIYYSKDELGTISSKELYKRAKLLEKTITHTQVNNFIKAQENRQITYKRKVKHYYPLISRYPYSRLQVDILDLIDSVPRTNKGYRYIFLCIDTFTRYVFAIPIKTKNDSDVSAALHKVVSEIKEKGFIISQIDSDNESSFLSRNYKKILNDNHIFQNLSQVNDHHSLGFIDRFCRTIRDILKRYSIAYDTNLWIDVLHKLIENYNNRVHSSIKMTPIEAITEENYTYVYNKMYKQIERANIQNYNRSDIQIGTKVRLKLQKNIFEKSQEQFTRTIHTVERIDGIKYYVNDRISPYKKSELLIVNGDVGKRVTVEEDEQMKAPQEVNDFRNVRRVNRRLNVEGILAYSHSPIQETNKQLRKYRKPRDMGAFISNQ